VGFATILSGSFRRYPYLDHQGLTILGYPDFYPSKGTEDEYKLTEKAITDGFENKPVITVSPIFPPCLHVE